MNKRYSKFLLCVLLLITTGFIIFIFQFKSDIGHPDTTDISRSDTNSDANNTNKGYGEQTREPASKSQKKKRPSLANQSQNARGVDSAGKKDSGKNQPLSDSTFEIFELSSHELESFYKRRFEPRERTLAIKGLKINKKPFQVETKEVLPNTIQIPLPDGGTREFTRRYVDFQNKNSFVWVGVATDNEAESIHLSFHNVAIVGHMETEDGIYEIKHLSRNKNIIRKVDGNQFPKNPNDAVVPPVTSSSRQKANPSTSPYSSRFPSPYKSPTQENSGQGSGQTQGNSGSRQQGTGGVAQGQFTIDIVVGYSHLIKDSEGGVDAALALVNNFIAAANTAYRNSETGVVIRPREIMELRVSAESMQFTNLSKMSEADQMRANGEDYDATNPYQFLIRKRHETNSDLAALITEVEADSCGIAYVLQMDVTSEGFRPFGMNVTAANCRLYDMAHEIGHNLGSQHNREDAGAMLILPYAYGFRSIPHQVRTVMSYTCNGGESVCPQIPYFSHPGKTVNGTIIGDAAWTDNSRSIREQAHVIRDIYEAFDLPDLEITQQPIGGNIIEGNFLELSVETVFRKPLKPGRSIRYQWYKDNIKLLGETNKTLILGYQLRGQTGIQTGPFLNFRESATYHVKVHVAGFDILNAKIKGRSGDVSVISEKVEVYFLKPPIITQQPIGGIIPTGGSLSLGVRARLPQSAVTRGPSNLNRQLPSTGQNFKYQWYKEGVALSGETGLSLTLNSSSHSGDSATYHVEVLKETNGVSLTTPSNEVRVYFTAPRGFPKITKQPRGGSVWKGSQLELDVLARTSSGGTLSYQWYKDGVKISGANSGTFNVSGSSSSVGSEVLYSVEVSTTVDGTQLKRRSDGVRVSFVANPQAPQILKQPIGGHMLTGSPPNLSVLARDPAGGPLSYQWYKDGAEVSGANRRILAIHETSYPVGSTHRFSVDVSTMVNVNVPTVVNNERKLSTRSNSVVISFVPDSLAPQITQQPTGGSMWARKFLKLESRAVSSFGSVYYQWHKDGTPISGATDSAFTIDPSSHPVGSSAIYYVKAFNQIYGVRRYTLSNPVTVSFITPPPGVPEITRQPTGGQVWEGNPLQLSVEARAPLGGTLEYQWYLGNSKLYGQNSSTLTVSHLGLGYLLNYYVVVSTQVNGVPLEIRSDSAQVSFIQNPRLPTIIGQPIGGDLLPHVFLYRLLVRAQAPSGGGPLEYQWYKDGKALSGETRTLLDQRFSSDPLGTTHSYFVKVSSLVDGTRATVQSDKVYIYFRKHLSAPIITMPPVGGIVSLGQPLVLAVDAMKAPETGYLMYQWYKGDEAISRANNSTLLINLSSHNRVNSTETMYSVAVSSRLLSDGTLLTVKSPEVPVSFVAPPTGTPQITTQPSGSDVIGQTPLTLSVQATAPLGGNLTYQWYKNWDKINGATSSTFTVTQNSQPSRLGISAKYYVEVSSLVNGETLKIKSNKVTVFFIPDPLVPIITKEPVRGEVTRGRSLELRVEARTSPDQTLEYQWYKNGMALSDENRSNLVLNLPNELLSTTAVYFVEVSTLVNGLRSKVRSQEVAVFFRQHLSAPIIIESPIGGEVSINAPLTLDVFASQSNSTTALIYQWYKDGVAISGATNSSLTIDFSYDLESSTAMYSVEVSARLLLNGTLVKTKSYEVPVFFQLVPPLITTQPTGGEVWEGNPLQLSVTARSPQGTSAPFIYQWYKDGSPVSGAATLTVDHSAGSVGSTAKYYVEVFRLVGSHRSKVKSDEVTVSFVEHPQTPRIISQPIGGKIWVGGGEVFSGIAPQLSVTAELSQSSSGSGATLEYQWYKDGSPVNGATQSSLVVDSSEGSIGSTAKYYVEVSLLVGEIRLKVKSDEATVSFVEHPGMPRITSQPIGGDVWPGEPFTLSVAVENQWGTTASVFEYRWYKDEALVSDETTSQTLTVNTESNPPDSLAKYYVEVSLLADGTTLKVKSNEARVLFPIHPGMPTITTQPQRGHVPSGGSLELSVQATTFYGGNLTYQWYKNGAQVSGANSRILTVDSSSHSGRVAQYYVEVATFFQETKLKIKSHRVKVYFGGSAIVTPMLAVGGSHTCALLVNGTVKCWGANNYGQLGQGHTRNLGDQLNETIPIVSFGTGLTAKAVAAGENHNCVLLSNNKIKCWGHNDVGQLGLGHTRNLGDEGAGENETSEMADSLPYVDLGTDLTAKAIAVGRDHSCAILSDDSLKCWGSNDSGQLGQGHTDNLGDGSNELGLTKVVLGSVGEVSLTVKAVSLGGHHTCAILSDDSLKCWGANSYGQLGQGHTNDLGDEGEEEGETDEMGQNLLPVALGFAVGVSLTAKAISAGSAHTCAILSDDSLKCWGANSYGQLGQGQTSNFGTRSTNTVDNISPIDLGHNLIVKGVTTGNQYTCAVLSNSQLKCWGRNVSGQLGQRQSLGNLGDDTNERGNTGLPVVHLGADNSAVDVSAGVHANINGHACVLLSDDLVKCWGNNNFGQLGLGHTRTLGDDSGEMGEALPPLNHF